MLSVKVATIFSKKRKNADVSKINWVLVLKGIISETIYMCVIKYQRQERGWSSYTPPSQNETLTSLPG